jgi:hypothetical protein
MSREAACWARARRKFDDLHAARSSALTTEAQRRIADLYVIEGRNRRQAARPRPADPANLLTSADRRLRVLAAHLARYTFTQVRHGGGDPVRPQAVASATIPSTRRRHPALELHDVHTTRPQPLLPLRLSG